MERSNHGSIDLTKDPLRLSRTGGFKSVQLNLAGWGVLVGVGLLIGALVIRLTPLPVAVALPLGMLSTWGVLLLLDNHRWRNSMINIGRGGLDEATGSAIVARLREIGIDATYREDDFGDGVDDIQRGIVCRQADADTVRRVLSEELA